MRFSARTTRDESTNALTVAFARARARAKDGGPPVLDLTTSNPTTARVPYAEGAILAALADPRAMVYAPEPLGLPLAREAVARDWRARGAAIDASCVAMTASTSEAYASVFKLLCDPGDELLVPAPSYPLLDHLAAFDAVTLRTYPLVHAGGWHVDVAALRASIGPRTRGIVVVSPNNPTGSYLGEAELEAMLDTGLPVVCDEVFASYPLDPRGVPPGRVATVLGAERGLVFALSGLSKLAALPQMKAGWIGVAGERERVRAALSRLELVLDAYLSVSTPVQYALPVLLETRAVAEDAIRARTRKNLAVVRDAMARAPSASVLHAEGGWYVVVRVPETRSDEEWALRLANEDAVLVQPGYLFDMTRGAHLVLGLLTEEDVLAEGVARIATRIAEDA